MKFKTQDLVFYCQIAKLLIKIKKFMSNFKKLKIKNLLSNFKSSFSVLIIGNWVLKQYVLLLFTYYDLNNFFIFMYFRQCLRESIFCIYGLNQEYTNAYHLQK